MFHHLMIRGDDILSKGKQKEKVKARNMLCFWAVRELGMSLTELARHVGLSVPAIGSSVKRGGKYRAGAWLQALRIAPE
jgi:hypothetical protein